MTEMPAEPGNVNSLLTMPLEDALAWLLGGGGGIVTGGLGYKLLFGRGGQAPNPQSQEEAKESLKGLQHTMSEIRDHLREFCSGVTADHARQLESLRLETEALQRLAEMVVRIDARLNGRS